MRYLFAYSCTSRPHESRCKLFHCVNLRFDAMAQASDCIRHTNNQTGKRSKASKRASKLINKWAGEKETNKKHGKRKKRQTNKHSRLSARLAACSFVWSLICLFDCLVASCLFVCYLRRERCRTAPTSDCTRVSTSAHPSARIGAF